jgi:hypothetical protein
LAEVGRARYRELGSQQRGDQAPPHMPWAMIL